MRILKVGETTYLAADAATVSELLGLEPDEFWKGVTGKECVELDGIAGELGTLPDWWFEIFSIMPIVLFDTILVEDTPLQRVTSVKPQGILVRTPGNVAGPIYPSGRTYIRGVRELDEEKP